MADLSTFGQTYDNAGAVVATLPANNYKTVPFTNYSTRKFEFFAIALADVHIGYADSNSLFTKAIKGIQTIAQVVFVGEPLDGDFVVAVEADTNPASGPAFNSDSSPSKQVRMKAAIDVATGATSTVTYSTGFVGSSITFA